MAARIYDLTLGASDLDSLLAACIAALGGPDAIREAFMASVESNFRRRFDDLVITAEAFEDAPSDIYLSLRSHNEGEFVLIHPSGAGLAMCSGECELIDADPRMRLSCALAEPDLRFAVLAHDEGTFPSDAFLAGDEDRLEYHDCVLLAVIRDGARWAIREPYGPRCNPAAPAWLGDWVRQLQASAP